jgi:hypothetical protein
MGPWSAAVAGGSRYGAVLSDARCGGCDAEHIAVVDEYERAMPVGGVYVVAPAAEPAAVAAAVSAGTASRPS